MTIRIAVINESTVFADVAVAKMVPALAEQWNRDLLPVWGVDPGNFVIVPKGKAPENGMWWLVFLDDSDQADALAYHDLTDQGLPISKVFVKTITADKQSVSVGASHECLEMAVDPWLNSAYQDSTGTFWAGEIADPVEDDQYGYDIGGVLVSDFVTPNWFGHEHPVGPIDFKGHAKAPFQVLSGGYAQKFDPASGWVQIIGAQAQLLHRAVNPPIGSRRNRRVLRTEWRLSAPRSV